MRIYKEQQSTERGFRFIKDPLFFADSLFVKNPERVETMMMLMALCLLVYNLGQRQLRISLTSWQQVTGTLGISTGNFFFIGFTNAGKFHFPNRHSGGLSSWLGSGYMPTIKLAINIGKLIVMLAKCWLFIHVMVGSNGRRWNPI